jgi:Amino acid transporters
MPDPEYLIEAPVGQVLPYLYAAVTGSAMGGLALTILVLVVTFFCSVSVTVATSRCTWAFARDKALPLHQIWSKVDKRLGTTLWALVLTTVVQMLVSLINIGSSSAFLAFVSVGVISLAIANAIPIAISVCNGRNEVNSAPWTMGAAVGWPVNMVALLWTAFEVVLFSMPQTLPVTGASMNYGSTVFVGLLIFGGIYYATYGHRGEKPEPHQQSRRGMLMSSRL